MSKRHVNGKPQANREGQPTKMDLRDRPYEELPQFLSPEELADILRVHPYTIYADRQRGKLPYVKVGNKYRFPKTVLLPKASE